MVKEIKVGITVIFSLALLLALVFALQGWWITGRGYIIYAIFPYAGGLEAGAPVRLSGVEVGRVLEVSLTPDAQAKVKMRIKKGVAMFSNYVVRVSMPLLGERFVDIRPIQPRGRLITEGDTLKGETPVAVEAIMGEAQLLLQEMRSTVSSLRGEVYPLFKENIRTLLANAQILLERASIAVDSIGKFAEDIRPSLRESGEHIEGMTANLEEAASTVRETIAQGSKHLLATTENIAKTSEELQKQILELAGNLQGIVEELRKASSRSEQIANNIEASSLSLQKAMSNLENITADIRALTGNKEFMSNIQEGVKSAKEAMEEAKQLIQEAQRLLKRVGKMETRSSTSLSFNEETEKLRLGTRLYLPNQRLLLGLWDIGEKNKIDLQRTWTGGNYILRGGIVRSKPGVGLDFSLPFLSTSLDLYGLNKPRADLYLNWGKDLRLQLGVEGLFSSNEFIWGVQYNR